MACINELIAQEEINIWYRTPIPYNTGGVLTYIRHGCIDCKSICEYYSEVKNENNINRI